MPTARRHLPLAPLLAAHRAAGAAARTTRETAIAAAAADWFRPAVLDESPPDALAAAVTRFASAVLPVVWHPDAARRAGGALRHALAHLLRGTDPLQVRFARVAAADGVYAVPGFGPLFWAALAKATDPRRLPDWRPDVAAGLVRVGELPPKARGIFGFGPACDVYARLLGENPDLTAADLDGFFARVAAMRGRELPAAEPVEPDRLRDGFDTRPADPVADAIRAVRNRLPLRKRIATQLPTESPLSSDALAGVRAVDDAVNRDALVADIAGVLAAKFRVHPLEVSDVLAHLGRAPTPDRPSVSGRRFGGFCTDTFRFLGELATHNDPGWMAAHRGRYHFAVREPLVELCDALAERYVAPVLVHEYGWAFDTAARPGRALSGIFRNDFGRDGAYRPEQSVTFARTRGDVGFVVRVGPGGVACGFRLGANRESARRFRAAVRDHADLLFDALRATGAVGGAADDCEFAIPSACAKGSRPEFVGRVRSAVDLRAWAAGKDPVAERAFPADAAVLRSDDLVGEVMIAFDRLVPLFAAAADADPVPVLSRRAGLPAGGRPFDRAAFRAATGLGDTWVGRALDLLRLKKQLVFQGVPGTGKTHVARNFATLLAGGRAENVRLVQFHPGYSYEEFVEGIRPQSFQVNGRTEIAYPVADGVLTAFAARAAGRPSEPHVLVVDELNRGNLPRVFGELLFLLEYRDQAVTLPYSKREFRLPANLYLIATMNAADRSTAALDQAMRRRFSFVEMPPDAAVLAGWLDAHPPIDADGLLGPAVVKLFDDVNRRLARDLGPDRQIGHSFFMVPNLTPEKLRAVWDHHVGPLLDEWFAAHPDRRAGYGFDRLFGTAARTPPDGHRASRVRETT